MSNRMMIFKQYYSKIGEMKRKNSRNTSNCIIFDRDNYIDQMNSLNLIAMRDQRRLQVKNVEIRMKLFSSH